MKDYVCKVANMEEIMAEMDYQISLHPGDKRWEWWKKEAKNFFEQGKRGKYERI